jgi:hypothetical protein
MNMKTVYKVSSPTNFRKDPNIEQGTFRYFSKLPDWAKNNPNIVIEVEERQKEIPELELTFEKPSETEKTELDEKILDEPEILESNLGVVEEDLLESEDLERQEGFTTEMNTADTVSLERNEPEEHEQENLECADCDFKAKSAFGLKIHRGFKHR